MQARRLMLAVALAAVCVVLSLALVSAQPEGAITLESVGIRYQYCTTPPKITGEQAIEAAEKWNSALFREATVVEAKCVVLLGYQYYTTDETDRSSYTLQDVTAWVVTLSGLSILPNGPRRPVGGDWSQQANTELNVVIDAQTGEYMMAFSYR